MAIVFCIFLLSRGGSGHLRKLIHAAMEDSLRCVMTSSLPTFVSILFPFFKVCFNLLSFLPQPSPSLNLFRVCIFDFDNDRRHLRWPPPRSSPPIIIIIQIYFFIPAPRLPPLNSNPSILSRGSSSFRARLSHHHLLRFLHFFFFSG